MGALEEQKLDAHFCRREDEICNLLCEDLDEGNRTGIVRDAKHPRLKEDNHWKFKMTGISVRADVDRWSDLMAFGPRDRSWC